MKNTVIELRGAAAISPSRAEHDRGATEFDALYRAHAGDVHRFALWLSGDAARADDITSETFVRAWTARDRLDFATVKGYLLTIARHLYLRGQAPERRHAEIDPALIDPNPGPHARIDAKDELARVLADLQTLPEIDRAALLMRAHEQLSYEDIAVALEITVVAAKVKVHRARRLLAERRLSRERNLR